MVALNGTVYLATGESGSGAGELWKSDGTAAGTVLLRSFTTAEYYEPAGLVVMNGVVYFTSDKRLWRTDGTVDGTVSFGPIFQLFGRTSP